MVGAWKSHLSNFGGTGPDPTMGGAAEAVVVLLLVDAAVLEEAGSGVTGSTDTEGELEPEGSPVAGVLGDKTTFVDEAEASDCACLACFLAAAFVCQPHEHGLTTDGLKKDPCLHLLMEAIAAKTSLLEGFWPLPVNAGRPSARSINLSAYCPMPWKW